MLHIPTRSHRFGDLPANHQLRRAVTARFEQDRIEPHAGLQPGRPGLDCLGAADLATFDSDHGVVGHVLRLERRNPDPAACEQSAQARHHRGLPRVGAGARDQQRPAHPLPASAGRFTAM